MSFRTMEDQQRAIQAAALKNAKKNLVAFVYQRFPEVVQCEASARMIIELVERWGGPDIVPTPEAFLSMLDENGKDALSMLARQPVERTKHQIIEEILSLLASKNGGRDGKFDSYNLRSEENRMASWTLDALRTRLAEIKTKQRMATTSVSVLKSFVAEARGNQNQYPSLPKSVWMNGAIVPLNAATFKAMDAYELKRYLRLYGPQVNERIAQG